MFNKLLHTRHTPIQNFIDILCATKFNQRDAEKIIKKVNKDYVLEDGDTLLDMCLRKNRFKAASWLVQQNVKITSSNKENISTVRLAVEKGQIIIVDELVNNYDFNINQVNGNGRTLLQDAVIQGYEDIAKVLIDKQIDPNIKDQFGRNVLFDAVNYGDDKLLDTILNINNIDMNIIDSSGKTVLLQKTVLENDKVATRLLKYGSDPTIAGPDGYSFLAHVAMRGALGKELLDTAISYGCNLNAKMPNENSVLMEVMKAFTQTPKIELERRSELKNVANDLLKQGADVNLTNQYNETLLFRMIRKNDLEGCAFALKNEAQVNIKNIQGETPLLLSVLGGIKKLDITILLLQYKADIFETNKYNQTVYEVINDIVLDIYKYKPFNHNEYLPVLDKEGQYLIVLKELLKSFSKDKKVLDSQGNPLFFTPFLYGEMNIIKLYLQKKIDINQTNKEGHNLFYEFILKSIEQNIQLNDFKEKLTFLLVNGSDITCKNHHGQNIYSKIASIPNCDLKLFRKLVELTKHDYYSVDNLGRTIIHACVFSNNFELFNLVYGVQRDIHHIADNYNILPITYAAVLGRKEIVIALLKRDSKINSGKPIPVAVRKKFSSMMSNLDKLHLNIEDPIVLRQITILCEQVRKDLTV
jgi:ankyrin repeat protein